MTEIHKNAKVSSDFAEYVFVIYKNILFLLYRGLSELINIFLNSQFLL